MKSSVRLLLFLMIAGCSGPVADSSTSKPPTPQQANLVCWKAPTMGMPADSEFRDRSAEFGLIDPLTGMHGHAAAVGDVNDDGLVDLFVGTFADRPPEDYALRGADGPRPDQLLLSAPAFTVVENWSDELVRTSGALFADLDGDADDDLVVVRHGGVSGDAEGATELYENREGILVSIGELIGPGFRGRTPTAADFNSDGLLDLYVSEDRYGETGGLLLINRGGLSFSDETVAFGVSGQSSLGAQAADLNLDSFPDLVLSNAVFMNRGGQMFVDVTPDGFETSPIGPDDDPAGVATGDLNNDGLPDIVLGQHFRSIVEVGSMVPLRVFLNNSTADSVMLIDVTNQVGLPQMRTLAPDVHIADIDNDGLMDIVTSASAGSGLAVFTNQGGDLPRFLEGGPTGSAQYWIGAPVVDFDRDGRLDVFAVEWEPSLPSRLFGNAGGSGHWVEISIGGPGRGVGSVVTVKTVDGERVGRQEIVIATGYSSAGLPVAHFGLGSVDEVVVEIVLPSGDLVTFGPVASDAHLRWPDGCG